MIQTIDDTLAERGSRYGEFPEHAFITQELKRTMHDNMNWDGLDVDMKEALDMVAHKIGRIINGDPQYIDSWTDIIGYTRLVEKRLINEQTEPTGDRRFSEEAIAAAVADFDDEDEALEGCPCIICSGVRQKQAKRQDTQEEVSILDLYERLTKAIDKREDRSKPSDEEISAALDLLLSAGVISRVEDGNT